ncbi:hypothetical protein PISL3812_09682 [Talaromyces islandicus]|uniref:CBF1-interacting co-repressor CIR N-terminal domain-containing protein n=1 Tax=Talaromyces islandicus TaxID=28573 RepID=A0A0U1MAP1_TALIS|nr:hypothetical protein PISL3812_09682 [Talaromyces islandicus]
MPLHLLGKKSWNVYNPENIARVRRDEEAAKAREEEEERRMQEVDAERRIKILRGERPPTPPSPPSSSRDGDERGHRRHDATRHRKRRRIAGEDDTDRDIRFAKEDAVHNDSKRRELLATSEKKNRDAHVAIVDTDGHLNLFTEQMTRHQHVEKNAEAEAEAAKKKRAFEDQYTMRFSNAAGYRESINQAPWYSSSATRKKLAQDRIPSKDVWGNEDPMRQAREKARIDASDPLAAMKAGVRGVKKVQRERKQWQEEKLRELEELKRAERSQNKHGSRRRRSRSRSRDSLNSLEGFSLDSRPRQRSREKERHRSRHHHQHHSHRDRDSQSHSTRYKKAES